jgi:hypothetical protein
VIGLRPFAERIADAVDDAARARTSSSARRNRVITASERVMLDAYVAGIERAMIAVRNDPAAVEAIISDMGALANEFFVAGDEDGYARIMMRRAELRRGRAA